MVLDKQTHRDRHTETDRQGRRKEIVRQKVSKSCKGAEVKCLSAAISCETHRFDSPTPYSTSHLFQPTLLCCFVFATSLHVFTLHIPVIL